MGWLRSPRKVYCVRKQVSNRESADICYFKKNRVEYNYPNYKVVVKVKPKGTFVNH